MVQKTSSGSSHRHSSGQFTLPSRENRKEDILMTTFRDEIVKGLLNHRNVEENTSEKRRQKLEFPFFQ
jgi:hypothetical protein